MLQYSILWRSDRHCFRVSNIVDYSPPKYCLHVVLSWIMYRNAISHFEMSKAIEQNTAGNYSLARCCLIMMTHTRVCLYRSHFFKQNRVCRQDLNNIYFHRSNIRPFLLKWDIYSNRTFLRTIHLLCVLPWCY